MTCEELLQIASRIGRGLLEPAPKRTGWKIPCIM